MPLPVLVMIDGPYDGCSLYLGEYESMLLVAGGSGLTFTLGLLDDLVGRIVGHPIDGTVNCLGGIALHTELFSLYRRLWDAARKDLELRMIFLLYVYINVFPTTSFIISRILSQQLPVQFGSKITEMYQ